MRTIEPMTEADYAECCGTARAGRLRPRPERVQARGVHAQPVPLECRRQPGVLTPPTAEKPMQHRQPGPRAHPARRERELRSRGDRLHPARRGERSVRDPRPGRQAPRAALRRSGVSRRVGVALSAGRLSREMPHEDGARHAASPRSRSSSRFRSPSPGMSFGSLSANVKEALGRAATELGTSTTTGDGGMTQEERRVVEDAGLPVPAVALRLQPGRPAQGRRDRGRDRPGRQARRRRHAARPEDQPARGEDAHAAGRHRPALGLPASRTGPGPTIWRSRSTSCARSPTGRCRST